MRCASRSERRCVLNAVDDRFSRQTDLIPHTKLNELLITVIGVGAIGRQVALQLAAIGTKQVHLIDFDIVEPVNITTQGYLADELGLSKVAATARMMQRLEPNIAITQTEDRFRAKYRCGDAVFCCVDSISARAAIWRTASSECRFWCDGRMLGEVLRIVTVADDQGRDHYTTTLFDQADAAAGRCTARGTIYTANIAAGLMLHQFTRWLRDIPVDRDLSLNLLSSELCVR